MKKAFLLVMLAFSILILFGKCKKEDDQEDDIKVETGSFSDPRDGQTYKWIKIGDQVWMAENLNFTSANSWCYDDNATNCDHYGRLYNWAAAMAGASSSSSSPSRVQGVCPPGWHVPSDAEWAQLENYVISQGYPNSNVINGAGNALKSCHQVNSLMGGECNTPAHPRWDSHSTYYGTDAFGFSALPGGIKNAVFMDGSFDGIGRYGYLWSATEYSLMFAYSRGMSYEEGGVNRGEWPKETGFSVRCVQDAE